MIDLGIELLGTRFQNPVLLASGTCGFGQELAEVAGLERLGGFVTKSVTLRPRRGNAAPRVSEFDAGMLNSIGLANPGVEAVCREKLPWIRDHVRAARVLVSIAGHTPDEYERVLARLDEEEGFLGYELNLSCPNDDTRDGVPFALDPEALGTVTGACRALTRRPISVKLAPNTPNLPLLARVAEESGADALTLVNTMPGLVLDARTGRPHLGAGPGGMSGPAMRPVGVLAVWQARQAVGIPLIGVGGIVRGEDAIQYVLAGASLVQVGTASFADPRAGERIADELRRQVAHWRPAVYEDLVGAAHGVRPETGSPTLGMPERA